MVIFAKAGANGTNFKSIKSFRSPQLAAEMATSEHHFAVGAQWHPERDFEGNATLFREFVNSAK